MPYNIAFDVAHKPRGKIDENLTELRDFLKSNDFACYNFLETPVTQRSLKPFDVLVFVCPDFAKISSMEISEIINWVKEDGGGLLLLSHAGGDRGRSSNLNELSQNFGIGFENDQVLDQTYNLGMENMPIITSFIPPHPITNGLTSMCYRSGCSLTIVGNAFSVASSNETSEPFSSPLICVAQPENGRVCALGSYEMLRDNVGGGFNNDEHPNLAFNLFTWLVSEYRMELRASGEIPEIKNQEVIINPPSPTNFQIDSTLSSPGGLPKIDVDLPMTLSNKDEVLSLLIIFQNQLNTMKSTINDLIKTFSGGNINEATNAEPTISKTDLNPPPSYKSSVDQSLEDLIALEKTTLTDLPPKPEGLTGLTPVPKSKSKKRAKKKDLIAEKDGLENKINSMKNLLDFIEKKHSQGQMDDKSYEKRVSQLQSDIRNNQDKLDGLKKLL